MRSDMACICPSVTPYSVKEYKEQLEKITSFSERIHVDLMDGEFVETRSPELINYWWPDGIAADIHLMYQHPEKHVETLISLKPNLVIVHAEAAGLSEFRRQTSEFRRMGIKRGIALLADTHASKVEAMMHEFDHVLIFSGKLGHYGGVADLDLLKKASEIRHLNSDIQVELGWDGGVNPENAKQLVAGGIDVLNVGGAIQHADNPHNTYVQLVSLVS